MVTTNWTLSNLIIHGVKIIVMILLLLGFGGVLNVFYPIETEFLLLFFCSSLLILNKGFYIKKNLILIVLLSYIILSGSIIVTKSSFSDYKVIFIRLFSVLLLITSFKNSYSDITKYFILAVEVITVLAFINFAITIVAPNLYSHKSTETGYEVDTIFFIFNKREAIYQIKGLIINRNQGIFWEPGILQIVVNILIFYKIFEKKETLKNLSIPIFVLLTTGSTTGFILFFIILLSKYLKSFNSKSRKKEIIGIIGLSFFLILFIPIMLSELNHKFKGDAKASAVLRTYDTLMGAQIALSYPLTGIGINKDRYDYEVSKRAIMVNEEIMSVERGNTNSIISLSLYFGLPITLILLYFLFNQNLFNNKWLFFIIIIISLSSEPLALTNFVILLMMSSYKIKSNIN